MLGIGVVRLSAKRILGIVAGPHSSGNTAVLVKEILKGADGKGYEPDLVCLGDLKIGHLVDCSSEKPYGVIGPEDDMVEVYPLLEGMSAFVLGTPIYFDHVAGRAKTFIDRLIYYSNDERKDSFPRDVPAVIVVTYEWDRPDAYAGVVEWMTERLEHYFKMKVVASIAAENTLKSPVAEREDLLEKAFEIGSML
jgi:multimeric flavodoxin WrbA